MRNIVIAIVALLVVISAGILSLPMLLGGEFVTTQLQQAVSRHTGRTLTLLKAPTVSLLPEPSIRVQGAALSNPQGMFDGTTVSMEQLEARIPLWKLLNREISISELTLIRPRVTLTVDKQGRANWQLPDSAGHVSGQQGAGSSVQLSVAPVKIVDGEINYTDERSGTTFNAISINARADLPLAGRPLKLDGSLRWNGELVNVRLFVKDMDRLAGQGSPVEIALNGALLEAALSGRAKLGGGLDLAGQADISAGDVRKLAAWAGWQTGEGNGLKDLTLSGALSVADGRASLEDAKLNMDGMAANGLVRMVLSGDRPRLEASLGVNRLDLNTYAPAQTGGGEAPASAGWSDQPVSLEGLGMADATLRLRIGELVHRNLAMKDLSVDAKLSGGKLSAKLNQLGLYGGNSTGVMEIDGSQNMPQLAGKLTANGADAKKLLSDFAGLEVLSGQANIELDLAATGRSQREMVSTLAGNAALNLREGLLEGIDLTGIMRGVQSSILEGWTSAGSGNTRIDSLTANFELRDGIARATTLQLLGDGIEISGTGTADLLRRRLDFKMSPKVASGADGAITGLPVAVVVSGPWDAPKIYPDIEGILQDPQSAFDTLGKLGVNVDVDSASGALRSRAEKLLGEDGARQAEDLGGEVLKNLFNQAN